MKYLKQGYSTLLCSCNGVTMGDKEGHLPPGTEFGGRQIEVVMLRNKYEISTDAKRAVANL